MHFEAIEDSAPWGLPLDEVTLAERFKAAGYATHMVRSYNRQHEKRMDVNCVVALHEQLKNSGVVR